MNENSKKKKKKKRNEYKFTLITESTLFNKCWNTISWMNVKHVKKT